MQISEIQIDNRHGCPLGAMIEPISAPAQGIRRMPYFAYYQYDDGTIDQDYTYGIPVAESDLSRDEIENLADMGYEIQIYGNRVDDVYPDTSEPPND